MRPNGISDITGSVKCNGNILQFDGWHTSSSTFVPGQLAPFWPGNGLLHVLILTRTPIHCDEHPDHDNHSDQPPSTPVKHHNILIHKQIVI